MKDPYTLLAKVSKRFNWLWKLIDRIRYGKEPVDPIQAEVARRAFRSGNIVVAKVDEDGKVEIKEIPRDKKKE